MTFPNESLAAESGGEDLPQHPTVPLLPVSRCDGLERRLDPVPGCKQSAVLSRSFLGSLTLRGEIQSLRPPSVCCWGQTGLLHTESREEAL